MRQKWAVPEITFFAHAKTVWRKRSEDARCVPIDFYQYIISEISGN